MEYERPIDVNELERWAETRTPGTLPLAAPSLGVALLSLPLVALVCGSTRLCPDVFLSFRVPPSSCAILHPVLLTLAPDALRCFRGILLHSNVESCRHLPHPGCSGASPPLPFPSLQPIPETRVFTSVLLSNLSYFPAHTLERPLAALWESLKLYTCPQCPPLAGPCPPGSLMLRLGHTVFSQF